MSSASRCPSALARATWTEASALVGATVCGLGAAEARPHVVAVSPRKVREVRALARRPFGDRWPREGLQSLASV
eukprot:1880136-Alexandrium_andersonii.AAC.1